MIAGCAKPQTTVVLPPPPPSPAPPPVKEKKEKKEKEEPPPPPPVLSSQVGREEEEQLRQKAEDRIRGAEYMVGQIDAKKLVTDQQEILTTIRSFLSKAKEALAIKDFLRASNLADKAKTLAEELLRTFR